MSRHANALKYLAISRQASVDLETAGVYELALSSVDPDVLERACRALGREPVEEFKPRLPEVGEILARCEQVRRQDASPLMLPPMPGEPLYRCPWCQDDPSGWVWLECPDLPCGAWIDPETRRMREHRRHPVLARCPCWLRKHAPDLRLNAEKARDKDRPVSPEFNALELLERGQYAVEHYLFNRKGAA